MKILLVIVASFFIPSFAFAKGGQKEVNPLYTLPKIIPEKSAPQGTNSTKTDVNKPLLATESGIYRVINTRTILPLWTEGKAKQILRVEQTLEQNRVIESFYFVTSKGILFSRDLKIFEYRNEGLPVLTIKKYNGKEVSFEKQVADIKDISYNPEKPNQMSARQKIKFIYQKMRALHGNIMMRRVPDRAV